MITVRLEGGLGNQLFQYATARALALRRGTTVGLDTRRYSGGIGRQYQLQPYRLPTTLLRPGELPPTDKHRIRRLLWSGAHPKRRIFREQRFAFDPTVLSLPDGTILEGYFQSPRYFDDAQTSLRNELTLRSLQSANEAVLMRIRDSIAVSVHIRRGDYATNPRVNRLHGVLDMDFYRAAVDLIRTRIAEPLTFFVFSDEPDWARANLSLPFKAEFLDKGDGPPAEHVALMSACRHHIVANSTFSWWGAWLNPHKEKVVVAPKRWFRSEELDASTLVPISWLRV